MSRIIRKGFLSLALHHLRKGEFTWLMRRILQFRRIRQAVRQNDGKALCGPLIAHYFCTAHCNLRCPMCDIPRRAVESELDSSSALRIIDEIADLGAGAISFTGGEPLLRPDLFALMARARARHLDCILVTNGTLLARYNDKVIAASPDIINISIDGSTAAIHDASRGVGGSFDTTLAAIREFGAHLRASRAPIRLVASTVLSEANAADIDNIVSLCKECGFDRIIICPVHDFSDRSTRIPPMPPTFQAIGKTLLASPDRRFIDNSDWYLEHLDSILSGQAPPQGCRSGYTTIFIDAAGRIYPCKEHLETGKVLVDPVRRKCSISEAWHSPEYEEFRRGCGRCTRCYLTVNREFDTVFS